MPGGRGKPIAEMTDWERVASQLVGTLGAGLSATAFARVAVLRAGGATTWREWVVVGGLGLGAAVFVTVLVGGWIVFADEWKRRRAVR
ncbi:MAG: hypothetical protein K2X87_11980 [Gemmataceae bacterium]|nr:hypothetical protein [Gemmataceae bacterium]